MNDISFYFIESEYFSSGNSSICNFLFSYSDVEQSFSSMIKSFYKLNDRLAPIRTHLIESIRYKKAFTSIDFSIIIQSLEGYHRRFINSKKVDLKVRIEEIVATFECVEKIKKEKINIQNVIKSRNYYSHFFEKNAYVDEGFELYKLTKQLRNLLICCVLNLIGCEIGLINELFNKNTRL